MVQPQVLQQVQVDELFVRAQRGWHYLFMALCVSTRLWLGGLISPRRDQQATLRLAQIVRRCAHRGPFLVVCDGFRHYGAVRNLTLRVALLSLSQQTPTRRVTDQQVRHLFMLIQHEPTLAIAAAKAGMDEKTARRRRPSTAWGITASSWN